MAGCKGANKSEVPDIRAADSMRRMNKKYWAASRQNCINEAQNCLASGLQGIKLKLVGRNLPGIVARGRECKGQHKMNRL